MARRKKQVVEENNVVEKESLIFNLKGNQEEIESIENESEENQSEIETIEETKEIIEEAPKEKSIQDLSYMEMKLFKRTGRIPK